MDQQFQGPNYVPPVRKNVTFARNLVFSILEIVFVPCFYGFLPLIFTIVANNAWNSGDFEAYEKKTKVANICLIIGAVIFAIEAVVVIGGFIYIFFGLAMSGF